MLKTVGVREQNANTVAATTDMRARAFTVFVGVYDQARRAVTYLYWDEEAVNRIAPSLYAGRT